VAELLGELLARMDTLTFKVAHVDTGWTRFTGTTNTQGRLLNGSPDPCDLRPDTATGLFVHMEQSYDGLRDNEESWLRVGDAVADAFAPQAIGEARRPTALPTSPLVIRSRPNPFNGSTAITLELRRAGRLRVQVHDLLGRRVATLHRGPVGAGRLLLSWRPEGVAAGRYLLRAEHSQGTVVHPLTYLK
jgi:hypothetical protein